MLQWFISFSEFTEFSESSAPFRKNSIRYVTIIDNEIIHIVCLLRYCHWLKINCLNTPFWLAQSSQYDEIAIFLHNYATYTTDTLAPGYPNSPGYPTPRFPTPRRDMGPEIPYPTPQKGHGTRDQEGTSDRHLWKHYLPATTVADGYDRSVKFGEVIEIAVCVVRQLNCPQETGKWNTFAFFLILCWIRLIKKPTQTSQVLLKAIESFSMFITYRLRVQITQKSFSFSFCIL